MRRSVREAIVGFSLLAAIGSAVGLTLWLKGLSVTRQYWTVEARFAQADGLAERSPVVFRGVIVGSVRSVTVTPTAVVTTMEITNPSLRLALPTTAEIGQMSLLSGESQVALVSRGKPLSAKAPSPRSKDCDRKTMLCDGATIKGNEGASLGSLTSQMYDLMVEIQEQKLVAKMANVATSVDRTSQEAAALLKQGNQLVRRLEASVNAAQPSIANLNASTAHLRQLMETLDSPQVVSDLQQTLDNAKQLTAQWEAVGGDLHQLTANPDFMEGMRSVAVGLGAFFDELYPARTSAARERADGAGSIAPAADPPAKPEAKPAAAGSANPNGWQRIKPR